MRLKPLWIYIIWDKRREKVELEVEEESQTHEFPQTLTRLPAGCIEQGRLPHHGPTRDQRSARPLAPKHRQRAGDGRGQTHG
jgi:hypothetical protein